MSASTHSHSHRSASTDRFTRRAWGTLLVLCGALFLDALDVSMIGVALPVDPDRPRHVDELAAVGRERVRARLRRLPAARRPRRRPARTAARLPDRARRVRRRLAPRRLRRRRHAADRDAASSRASARRSPRRPALSIITTTLRRGPGAQQGARRSSPRRARPGFSLGLVFGGLLTEIGWRWVFFLPAPVALVALIAGHPARAARPSRHAGPRAFDVCGRRDA